MLKQVNCVDTLWGTYHFNSVEPVASFQFADALFAEASHYEKLGEFEVKESEEGDKPDVWIPTSDNTKLFHSFGIDRKSTRLNSSHVRISYAVFCLKKKNKNKHIFILK